MNAGIFLIQSDGQLVEMAQQPYDAEKELQRLLADYPNLLAGDQINSEAPRRWLFISREVGVPTEEGGSNRWAADHLFLDQDAVPTIVEVKRSSNAQIRREIVGQMLDYAANAVAYWSVEYIRARFEARCTDDGYDPSVLLAELLEADTDQDEFWQKAKTNLQAGRVRLVFVADKIPPELQRVVEFLNRQMNPAEVLAVEIPQYVGKGLQALVPRVIGQTETKRGLAGERKQWDEASFFEEMERVRGAIEAAAARKILEWAQANVLRIIWGRGPQQGSFALSLRHENTDHRLISVWTTGGVAVNFRGMGNRAPFGDEAKRDELRQRLNRIPGISIAPRGSSEYSYSPMSRLTNEASLKQFLDALDWVVTEIRAT